MHFSKKLINIFFAGVFLVMFAVALCGSVGAKPLRAPGGGANGNKHDFSMGSGAPISSSTETRVCIFCHTPHGASAQSTLWNRPSPEGDGAFNLNDSSSLIIKGSAKGLSGYDNTDRSSYPNGSTRLCMSCHDGVVAIGAVLNGVVDPADTIHSAYVDDEHLSMKIDLATSHPVSFKYDADVLAEIVKVANKGETYQLPSLPTTPLDGLQRMQCTTCHDPHEDTKDDLLADSLPLGLPFWRHKGANSAASYEAVCKSCHKGAYGPVGGNH